MKKQKTLTYILCVLLYTLSSCEKFLDKKSDVSLSVPDNLEDLDALMNNLAIFIDDPRGGEISTDDYYVSEADFNGLFSQDEQNLYLWDDNVYLEDASNDWLRAYNAIYYCNIVLEKLGEIQATDEVLDKIQFNKIKGEALYHRGKTYFHAAQLWCNAYDASTAESDLGLPLRLSSNFNEQSYRSSLRDTYERIFDDLTGSSLLLPVKPSHPTKPSKPAAFGMLSRAYMTTRDYEAAGRYADSCLQLHSALLDFSTLDSESDNPIDEFCEEVIIDGGIGPVILTQNRLRVSEELVALYGDGDLRRGLNFGQRADGSYIFKGMLKPYSQFSGIATNEMYLNRAESYVRTGKLALATQDMDDLLVTRHEVDGYVPIDKNMDQQELLDVILRERRKELLFRGIRWMDIKRLNKDGRGITMRREWQGGTMEMQPNDLRFALPIPRTVIALTGMPQNPR